MSYWSGCGQSQSETLTPKWPSLLDIQLQKRKICLSEESRLLFQQCLAVYGVAQSRTQLKWFSSSSSSSLYLGEGSGNPLQYSCLENPVDRGAWWAAVHGVAQSRTGLKWLSMHAWIGEENGNPLQYSCLENPRDGGAWLASFYGVAQSGTRLKRLSSSSSIFQKGLRSK